MFELSGYEIGDIIYKSGKSTIYRAVENAGNKKVLIKLRNNEYPSMDELISINREFMITGKHYGDVVIKTYDIVNYKNSIAIILEDFGAKPLSGYLTTKKLDLKKKVFIAINIAEALVQIHKQGVIHKDINPSNIVWNEETDVIKVIDFGISTELTNQNLFASHVLEGTLLYISPEQTGKINRPVDYRSDLYSAGVTLYELFTGKPPFDGDELEIIHSHIAKIPKEPTIVSSEIPSIISDIIMKLLSKNAEDRYQTAAGLKYDLSYFLDNFYARDKIANFRIAQKDISNRFEIPQKLYGRETDISTLKEKLLGTDNKSLRLLLISGYSGIGKTATIQEISQEIIAHGGRFISGRFEQFERNNPYSAIKTALGMLVKNIILEAGNFDAWKSSLKEALGINAGLLVEFLPELEQILGRQPEICRMEPIEEKNRFRQVLSNFINVFTDKENKLILFLDDMQWSDLSSIDLLEFLLTSDIADNCIIIGSYRENEVSDGHPLLLMIDNVIKSTGSSDFICQHNLEPLLEHSVNQLIADTLKIHSGSTVLLTNYIYQKTKGNPFFTCQLLKSLYENGLFRFSEEKLQWEWHLDSIRNVQISENVIDFLIQNLKQLPPDTLSFLKLASCIGNQFDTTIIYKFSDTTDTIADAVQVAIAKEYILPLDTNYKLLLLKEHEYSDIEINFKFVHSRIQQAAYSLVSDKDRELIHYKIGRMLLFLCDTGKITEYKLFEITNHLNIGKNNAIDIAERLRLLDLNIKAGTKAKRNLAYDIAKNYFTIGKNVLSGDEWREHPEKLFDISLQYVECCYLSSDLENILALCDTTFSLALNTIEKAAVYELKARILDHMGGKRELIIDEIKKGLKLFHIDLPSSPEEINIQIGAGLGKLQGYLATSSVEELVNLPVMNNPENMMVMKLLFQLSPIAFEFYPPLNTLVQLIMFDTTIQSGTVEESCKNFAECGITLGPILGNYELAYRFNKAAFSLIDKYKSEALKASTYFIFGCFISHWKKHYSEGLEYFDLSIKSGIETGDIMHSFWSTVYTLDHLFFIGKNLEEYKLDLDRAEKLLLSHKVMFLLPFVSLIKHVISQFQSAYNTEVENFILSRIKDEKNMTVSFKFGHFNTVINYILENYDAANKWVEFTEPYIQGGTGLFCMADYVMFSTLSYIKRFENESDDKKIALLKKIDNKLESLKIWSANCPENFAHKYYIVAAERARINHDSLEVITALYKQALDSIVPGEFTNMRAVINELIGDFWFSRNEETIGNTFIKEALYFYNHWGATSKLGILEKKYAHFSSANNHQSSVSQKKQSGDGDSTRQTRMHSSTLNLDIKSILKSTQAISGEIKFDKLLKVLMSTIIENAGAQNGCVILKNVKDNHYFVEAVKSRNSDEIRVTTSLPLTKSDEFCSDIVEYVKRSHESIVVSNATKNYYYKNNEYIKRINAKSILCVPILYQNDLKGIIYLENNLSENVFDNQRIEIIEILTSQIAISVEKAQLYENLEEKVNERTRQLALANTELKELSQHDPLTKLYNRRYVYEHITSVSENFLRSKLELFFNAQKRDLQIENKVIGIYLLDIDHFKKVNDTYGHAAGDKVLVKVTEVLNSLVRSEDFIVRWGGEEFLIILNKTRIDYLEQFAERVLSAVKETCIELPNNVVIHKTCSIGCAYLPFDMNYSDLLTFEQTINICDFALYQAKEHGRDCSVHVSLAKPEYPKVNELKDYLINLTKASAINNDYINVKFIRGQNANLTV